jgi:cysteine desulfurase / selenocysteine lyase
MKSPPRIYLDNAATSWPKPTAVYDAVDRYQREVGVPVGRAATHAGVELQSLVDRCRQRAARLLKAESAERILFTFNGTDALNQAIHGLLGPGDHVLTSVAEHNSVLRPLRAAVERLGVEVSYLPTDAQGVINPDDVAAAIGADTKLVVLTHASNVTGAVQPIEEVGSIVRETDGVFLVDAAQTAGHLPINLAELPIDLLACSGHKGLLGPLGTGLLFVRPGVEKRLRPVRQGGTGSQSETDQQPATLPDRYESGNHNAPGLVGLEAALTWIEEQTVERIHDQETALTQQLLAGLKEITGLKVYGPQEAGNRVGVVSLGIEGLNPQEAASILDENFHIETRAGLHCAPRMHQALGTDARGGTLRLSLGAFTTSADIDAAIAALREVTAAATGPS